MNPDENRLFEALLDDSKMSEPVDLNKISEAIIGCSLKVGNTLGCGFLEKVYESTSV